MARKTTSDATAHEHAVLEHAVLELDRFLPYRLSVLSNRISQDIARLYAERFALGITEWRVLAVLGRYQDLSANELAERTAMDKVAVSRAVASLLRDGRLKRRTHGDDRRRSVLALSAKGYRIYDEVAPLALQLERELLACLSAEECDALARILDRLDAAESAQAR
ncbi:MAG TPA: MarR family winged helix-turn-helix transcriptional regulator [Xanthomonadaceae bacterium]|jgi:DNA-binding MarR family transcriptional regulator